MSNLKNTSIIRDMDGVLGTRSIFVCQVLAIEGDQSWNIVREEYLQSNGEDEDR